jgi:hypothetical protein
VGAAAKSTIHYRGATVFILFVLYLCVGRSVCLPVFFFFMENNWFPLEPSIRKTATLFLPVVSEPAAFDEQIQKKSYKKLLLGTVYAKQNVWQPGPSSCKPQQMAC